jgi:hypothetical protein
MRIELSYARLFEPKKQSPEVDAVLSYCISHHLGLSLTLGPVGVMLASESVEAGRLGVLMSGRWRSPYLEGDIDTTGALLLIPFVFCIERLSLQPGTLFTLGAGNRTVADLFMRNIFFAACRHEKIHLHVAASNSHSAVSKGSKDLMRTYLWLAKACLKEKIFDRDNALELVVANAHLPLFEFTNKLVEAGATELRLISSLYEGKGKQFENKRKFMQARRRMLSIF